MARMQGIFSVSLVPPKGSVTTLFFFFRGLDGNALISC